jgi:dTDP-4-dehydrorhamnose reductase
MAWVSAYGLGVEHGNKTVINREAIHNMKVLLLGKDGQVGWELQRSLAPLAEVVALGRKGDGGLVGDLADKAGLQATVAAVSPDVIVNAGAYTNFDRAETEPELVRRINTDGPRTLAEEAAKRGIWFIHYSTDYVFDGSGSRPWREDDVAHPLSVYGKSKLAGDEAIQASGCRHLILRVSWVHAAAHGVNNFASKILKLASTREHMQVVSDQFGAPTGADLIADVSAHLIRSVLSEAGSSRGGVYHLAPAGVVNRHEYANIIVDGARRRGVSLKVKDISPVLSSTWQSSAKRPLNSRLDTTRLQTDFGIRFTDWAFGVERLLDEISYHELENTPEHIRK